MEGVRERLLFEENVAWAEQLATVLCRGRRLAAEDLKQHGRVGLWTAIRRHRRDDPSTVRSAAWHAIRGTIENETARQCLFGDTRKFTRKGLPVPATTDGIPDLPCPEGADPSVQARNLVALLPYELRPFADAYWLRGLAMAEIAVEMECSESLVCKRLYLALGRLREEAEVEE